jgi:hypothetical protein
VIHYSPSWLSLARKVVELVEGMREEEIEKLKKSYVGGKKLLATHAS